MTRFLADACLRDAIVSGCLRSEPAIDYHSANDASLAEVPDPEVLALAAPGGFNSGEDQANSPWIAVISELSWERRVRGGIG
jgi:hypothetical protein